MKWQTYYSQTLSTWVQVFNTNAEDPLQKQWISMSSSCCLLSDLRRCIHSVLSEMSSSCCLIWAEQMSVHVISQLETRQATAGLLIIKGWFVSTIDNQILMRPAKWKVPTLNYPYFCYMPPLHEERMKTNRKLIVYSVLGTWSFWHLHSPGYISLKANWLHTSVSEVFVSDSQYLSKSTKKRHHRCM